MNRRTKWKRISRNLTVGDVVLTKDNMTVGDVVLIKDDLTVGDVVLIKDII